MTTTTIARAGTSDGEDAATAEIARLQHRLRVGDVVSVGTLGLRVKRVRTALTALGIAIGISAMVAVVGISASSRADLLAELDRLGTNLLQVQPGNDVFGGASELPTPAAAMIRRVGGVESAAATRRVETATVRRSDQIPPEQTGGITVVATEASLLDTLGGTIAHGTFLNDATGTQPAVVLGSEAARRLGIRDLAGRPQVYLGDRWFTVIGLLDPVPLAPDIDRSALIGYPSRGSCSASRSPHRRCGSAPTPLSPTRSGRCSPPPPTPSPPTRSR